MSSRKYSFKLFYISFCKIKSNRKILNSFVGARARKGSFGWARVSAETKCAICGLAVFFTLIDNVSQLREVAAVPHRKFYKSHTPQVPERDVVRCFLLNTDCFIREKY